MTVVFEFVKFNKPDCDFCGNWRDGMIKATDNMGGNLEKWICVICANGLCKALSTEKEKEQEKF